MRAGSRDSGVADVDEFSGGGLTAKFLGRVFDLVAHPIFVKDRAFRFVLLNRALCEMVGYPRDAMLGKTDFDFFPEAEARFFREKDVELFASGGPVDIAEERITDASGRVHILATTKAALRDDEGGTTHLVGIIHDITRLKETEEALRQANEALEARVRERTSALEEAQRDLLRKERLVVLGQLAGGLAHQVRNPLAVIANATSVLRRSLADLRRREVDETLDVIREEVFRADHTITGLLDFSRVRPPDTRPVDVADLVEHALEATQVPQTVEVEVDVPALPPVVADPTQVEGALANLLCNAVEAMPDGGKLTIRGRLQGSRVVIEVQDTGSGIAPDVRAHLFEPLVTTKPLGLGLGLSTARTLVEGQGGSLTIESREGEGAKFQITLPTSTSV